MNPETVIQMLHGAAGDKQTQACIEFALKQGWPVRAIFPAGSADEAVNLVDQGVVDLVLMPFVDRESVEIEARVTAAGGKVAYCRQSPVPNRLAVDTSSVIVYLSHRGRRVNEIAEFLRKTPDRVRQALRRGGINNPRE